MNIQILLWLFNSNSEINRLSSLKYIRFQAAGPLQPDYQPGRARISAPAVVMSSGLPIGHIRFVNRAGAAVGDHSHSVREPVQ